MSEQFLSVGEVAQILGWSRNTVLSWMSEGKMPGTQLALSGRWNKRQWRIPRGEFIRWMDEKGMRKGVDYVW